MDHEGFNVNAPDIRYIGRHVGRYALPERRSASGVSVFSCQTQSISPSQVVIAAPVVGEPGNKVSANIDEIGIIRGYIKQIIDRGFSIHIDPDENDIRALTARVTWLKKRVTQRVGDSRAFKRFLPRNPHTKLLCADGSLLDCFLIDLSRSGAALSADTAPQIGTPFAVGKMIGRVARVFEGGFAVQFLEPAAPDALEHLVNACDFENQSDEIARLMGNVALT